MNTRVEKINKLIKQAMYDIQDENPAKRLSKINKKTIEPLSGNLSEDKEEEIMGKLTKELAIVKVLEITNSEDVETRQLEQDNLYLWFIKSVSDGLYYSDEAQEIATIIRKTEELNFSWYA